MENFKNGHLSIDHEITLFKKDYLTAPQERERDPIYFDSRIYHVCYDVYEIRCGLFTKDSTYQSNLDENHWKVVKTIFKYLRNTKDQ